MAALRFVCHFCSAKISAPPKLAGMSFKCPSCQRKIKVPTEAASAAPAEFAEETSDEITTEFLEEPKALAPIEPPEMPAMVFPVEPPPLPVQTIAWIECPFCREDIRDGAKRCKHCGETLDVTMRAAEEAERKAGLLSRTRRRDREQSIVIDNSTTVVTGLRSKATEVNSCAGCLILLIVSGLMLWACSGMSNNKPVNPPNQPGQR
jgi:hypothetical protein